MVRYTYDSSGNLLTATVSSIVAPLIISQPISVIAAPGEMATFSVVVADTRGVTFQWKRNGVDIPGATGDSLLLSNVKTDDDKTKYSVVVTNAAGSVTSEAAELLLDSDRDGLPDSWEREKFKNPIDPKPDSPPNPANQRSETDPDKDGISNLDEFLDNTDPIKKDSLRPRLTAFSDVDGSVTVTPMKLSYNDNLKDSVTLTATPFGKSAFIRWAGDLEGTDNPATIVMDRNKTVRARFASGPVPLPFGLIALWRGETDGEGLAIDVIGGHHGTFFKGDRETGPTVTTAGKVGEAFEFDGEVHVRVPDCAALKPRLFTIEAWVFPTAEEPAQTIIARGSSKGDEDTWSLRLTSLTPRLISNHEQIRGSVIRLNEWTHLAGTFDGKSIRLYVNGALADMIAHSYELVYDDQAPVPVTIGSDWAKNVSSKRFKGRIDEVALYNRALSANEILGICNADFLGKDFAQLYFTAPPQLPDAVLEVGYTHQFLAVLGTSPLIFSLSAGVLPPELTLSPSGVVSGLPSTAGTFKFTARAIDATGAFAEQHCVLQVFASISAPAGLVGWWRAENNAQDSAGTNHGQLRNGAGFASGRVGRTFALDGKDDCVEIPDAPSLRPDSVTLEAWVAFDVPTSFVSQVIIDKVRNINSSSYALFVNFGTVGGLANFDVLSASFSPEPESWHHLAYAFDNNERKHFLYIDGIQVTSGNARSPIYTDQPLLLGCSGQDVRRNFLNGRIDEAAIYNRALSSAEIAAIFNAGAAGKTLAR